MEEKKHIITALVLNKSGVLTRISGLFARRGYNIDSLSVCSTEDPKISRMTIVVCGDDDILKQIVRQLDKVVDCIKTDTLDPATSVKRELLLIKLLISPAQRPEIESTCNMFKVKIIDLAENSVICEMTGEPNKIDSFIDIVKGYGILELARTGLTALSRGNKTINSEI